MQTLSVKMPAEPIQVDGDPVRLAQTLGNLLSNAAKYTPQGGAITLAAQAHADSVVLRVIDNGHGIAPELLSGVFDLFTQGHDSLDRAPGGLGIGLAVAREMTRLHGGMIEARSDGPGCGSEFVVTLPRYLPGTTS
jgi:signal transduction histidine kinase